jgi:hypothetical protein
MDLVGSAIYSILSADAELNGLVGNRIYPVIARQREMYPLLTYTIISNDPSDTKDGASTVDRYRIQFDIYGLEYDVTQAIAIRLREVIDRYPHISVGGIKVDGIRFIDQSDDYEDDVQLFRAISEYYLRVKRVPGEIDLQECFELNSFNFTLPQGDTTLDVGFLISQGHLVFAGGLGPMVSGADYTISGSELTLTDAPLPGDISLTIVRNRVRIREYTQPAAQATQYIGGMLLYPVLVFIGDTMQTSGVDYTIDTGTMEITWLNHPGVEFDFKLAANACR